MVDIIASIPYSYFYSCFYFCFYSYFYISLYVCTSTHVSSPASTKSLLLLHLLLILLLLLILFLLLPLIILLLILLLLFILLLLLLIHYGLFWQSDSQRGSVLAYLVVVVATVDVNGTKHMNCKITKLWIPGPQQGTPLNWSCYKLQAMNMFTLCDQLTHVL